MKSFKSFLTEEINPTAYVQSGKIGVDDPAVRDNINTLLNGITAKCFVSPYIAYERVSKVLASFHIHLPKTTFLENDSGMVVLPVSQFGGKFGMRNDGTVVTKEPDSYHIYFEYRLNDKGLYDVFCEILDETELEDIMDDLHDELNDSTDDDDETEQVQAASDMRDEKFDKRMYEAVDSKIFRKAQTHYIRKTGVEGKSREEAYKEVEKKFGAEALDKLKEIHTNREKEAADQDEKDKEEAVKQYDANRRDSLKEAIETAAIILKKK